jgi:heme/copper-type cytochrome/quinol oxidase subunit 3
VVSGIAISYIATPASAAGGSSGGAAGAARAAHQAATAKGLREGMWIWLGVLVALFGCGLLELRGSWRTAPAPTPTAAPAGAEPA